MNLTVEGRSFSIGMFSYVYYGIVWRSIRQTHARLTTGQTQSHANNVQYIVFESLNAVGDDINGAMLGSGDQVTLGELSSQQNAAIVLPGSLFGRISQLSSVGTVFGIYENTNLFPVGGRNAASDDNETIVTEIGSQILSATVGNDSKNLENLHKPVSVTLRLNINDTVSSVYL